MKRLESPLLSISATQDSKDFPKRQTNQSYNLTQSPNGFFCSLPERMSLFAFILWHVFTRKMQFFSSRHIFAIRAFSPFWEGMSRHVNAVGSIWAFKKVWQKCQKNRRMQVWQGLIIIDADATGFESISQHQSRLAAVYTKSSSDAATIWPSRLLQQSSSFHFPPSIEIEKSPDALSKRQQKKLSGSSVSFKQAFVTIRQSNSYFSSAPFFAILFSNLGLSPKTRLLQHVINALKILKK